MPVAHNKVILSGALLGGEVWSINPCFARNGAGVIEDFTDLNNWAVNIRTFLSTVAPTGPFLSLLGAGNNLNSVTTQYYDATGKLIQQSQVSVAPAISGNGSVTKPYQSAVVASLRTGRPGRSYRGRLYLVAMGAAVATNSARLSAPTAAATAAAIAALMKGIQLAAPSPFVLDLSVVSNTMSVATPVQTIEVGDVIDSMRRRRDALAEGYQSAPYPGP